VGLEIYWHTDFICFKLHCRHYLLHVGDIYTYGFIPRTLYTAMLAVANMICVQASLVLAASGIDTNGRESYGG
jgi:hypothetical protein